MYHSLSPFARFYSESGIGYVALYSPQLSRYLSIRHFFILKLPF